MFVIRHILAIVALVRLDVTNTMYAGQVPLQAVLFCKFPAANVALKFGARALGSAAAALSVSRVVVSADR